jgi:Ser/Thr protein kinase RdoA (MazF antagonist)
MTEPGVSAFREAIVRTFPRLDGSTIGLLAEGWHSIAVQADGHLVFKFPKSAAAEAALRREAALLAVVRPHIAMAVPDLTMHEGPPPFSVHEKLQGSYLLTEEYVGLPGSIRDRLAHDLGHFYAELHRLDADQLRAAGAGPVGPWLAADAVRARALPLLPPELRRRAEEAIAAYDRLPPDPYGTTYGFFDGHGWNMAFDRERGALSGVYDFGDSGFGPVHQEFIYSSMISPDLTERIVAAYEVQTDRRLDRERIAILTGYHRLWELAEVADVPVHVPTMMRAATAWFGRS